MIELLQAIVDGLSQGGTYAVLAVGLAIVSAVLSFPNFAHGWLVVWAALLMVVVEDKIPLLLAVVVGCVSGIALSVMGGMLILRWKNKLISEVLMLISLAFGLILQAVGILIFGESPRLFSSPSWFGVVWQIGGVRIGAGNIITLGVAVTAMLVLAVILKKTDLGLMMRAVAQEQETAAIVGIRTGYVVGTALIIAGILAGLGAFLWFAKAGNVTPRMGMDISMVGFIGLVIGGMRSIEGAALGGVVFGLVNALLATYLPPDIQGYTTGLTYVLLIAILLFRPEGLLQRKVTVTR